MEKFANTLILKEMHQTLVVCSPPAPGNPPLLLVTCPFNLAFFSLFIFHSIYSTVLRAPVWESINNVFLDIFFPSAMTLCSIRQPEFPQSSSPLIQLSLANTTLLTSQSFPPPAALKCTHSKRHTSGGEAGIFPILKSPIWKIHFAFRILSLRGEFPYASVLRALGMAYK